ncbi:MAG: MotA/TolQ/ExbB proton channel family protein [candidate division NC10 bacterium]|nr:MotA/TolQ/ExbB proton channel family protein [candidate division NC10 bacterium]
MGAIKLLIKGGVMMIPLLICSVVSLTIVIERFLYWHRMRSRGLPERMLHLVENDQIDGALELARGAKDPILKVLAAGIEHRNPSPTEAMEATALAEVPGMKQYLPVLDTIVTLAPLLGLLGTITGMISSFGIMSLAGIGQPHAITGGIAEALIATATGLSVAICTLIPYNYYQSKSERKMEEIETYASRLELLLKRKKEGAQDATQ